MTTVERWQGQLPSGLRGGEGSSTQVATQESPDVEYPEGLRRKFSNWRASVPFRSPPTITSKPAQQVDPKTPQYEESDSGIGITTPSSQDHQSEPLGLELPGTELRHFDRPVSDRLKARFFDIKVLYTQPLLDYILKRKKDPGDISMKLKYLGLSSLGAQLHIVIQCERKIAKRVRKFFAQGHVEEELLPDFRVFVLEKALLRLTDDDAIEVLTDSIPKRTWCGTPIRLRRGNMSVVATFGGIIVVEATHKRLVGLTAAHSLKKLHRPLSDRLSTHDGEVPFSSYSSDASESESDSDCESTITTESSVQHPEHLDGKGLDTTASQNSLEIGTILCNTFNSPMAQNYDWAIIDLSRQATLPNRVVLDGQSNSSDFEEESDLEPIMFPVGNPCVSVSRQVMVLKQGAKPIGEMSLDTSSVLLSPGSSFVEVYDLAMEHGSLLTPGDSGSWVVDAKTSVLYGHVVSIDAFGEAQVMPIRSTLDSIKVQMNATRVFLPNSDEIQMFQEKSRTLGSASLESALISDAYINGLGHVADIATVSPTHTHKPLEQFQGTDLRIRKKPYTERKSDTSMQMDVTTTGDIVSLDRESPTKQQIEPTLLPKKSNMSKKPTSTPGLPRKQVYLRNSDSNPETEPRTISSKSCLCPGSSHRDSSSSSSSGLNHCSCSSFRAGSPPPGRPTRGDYDKNTPENFHHSNSKSSTSFDNGNDPLGDELRAEWTDSAQLAPQMAHGLPNLGGRIKNETGFGGKSMDFVVSPSLLCYPPRGQLVETERNNHITSHN